MPRLTPFWPGQPATHSDLARLELTGRIIAETLRLHSPAWLLTRRTTIDTDLAGHSARWRQLSSWPPSPPAGT